MLKKGLIYGLIAGGIMLAFFGSVMAVQGKDYLSPESYHLNEIVGYATMIVALSMVFFGTRHYRNHVGGGTMTFGQGFKVGSLISFIAALVFGIFTVMLFTVFIPDLGERYLEVYREMAEVGGDPALQAQLQELEANKDLFLNPGFQGFLMFITVFMIGEVIAIISALFLKRKAAPVA